MATPGGRSFDGWLRYRADAGTLGTATAIGTEDILRSSSRVGVGMAVNLMHACVDDSETCSSFGQLLWGDSKSNVTDDEKFGGIDHLCCSPCVHGRAFHFYYGRSYLAFALLCCIGSE